MQHDIKRGRGTWTGCFSFDNIVFDGDKLNWSRPRSGGLKQGGTYWFYYRLDDQCEAYDDAKPFTTNCPLLPGQPVNVLDVPVEVLPQPSRCRSASARSAGLVVLSAPVGTLNPDARFAGLGPPLCSKVHSRCKSDEDLGGRLENRTSSAESFPMRRTSIPASSRSRARSVDSRASKRVRTGDPKAHPTVSSKSTWRSRLRRVPRPSLASFGLATAPGPNNVRSTTRGSDLQRFNFSFDESDQASQRSSCPTSSSNEAVQPPTHQYVATYEPTGPRHPTHYSSKPDPPAHYSLARSQSPDFSPSQSPEQAPSDPNDEFWSPTFSAITASSFSEGLRTPFRLSDSHQQRDATYDDTEMQVDNDIRDTADEVAERLRNLSTSDPLQANLSIPTSHSQTLHGRPVPQAGTNYYTLDQADCNPQLEGVQLPSQSQQPQLSQTIADNSARSLTKLSSHETRKSSLASQRLGRETELPLPPLLQLDGEGEHQAAGFGHGVGSNEDGSVGGESLADVIFGELGYLGGSIV